MLNILREKNFAKKILLFSFIGTLFFFLFLIYLPFPNINKNIFILFNIIVLVVLYIIIIKVELNKWLGNNINYLKRILILMLGLSFITILLSTIYMDYRESIKNVISFSMLFVSSIFIFMFKTNTKEDINLSINALKMFASVIVLMSIMLYITTKDIIMLNTEGYKLKIENSLNDKEKLLEEHEKFVKSVSNLFLPKEIKFIETIEDEKINKREFMYIINIASSVILITIIICILQIINNTTLLTDRGKYKK
ncbi:hypothetical protein CP964_07080 [Arcobacter defluvii]|uniref:Membrane protein n=2 Tax=Arcobacter defluvii TaxID=873191 RepID=A0AAE7BHX6_9BACT|nr:hypothetical protein [Arcobacter defluvii]QKF78224.1 putative membrane protein [Arcobacter defluvii]RXI33328.1 hypothetical protein CP964_07080 [Arcobacter defluvii]